MNKTASSWPALLAQLQAMKGPCPAIGVTTAFHYPGPNILPATGEALPTPNACSQCAGTGQVQHPLARELYQALTRPCNGCDGYGEWPFGSSFVDEAGKVIHEPDCPQRRLRSANDMQAAAIAWWVQHGEWSVLLTDLGCELKAKIAPADYRWSRGNDLPAALSAALPALLAVKA